MQFTQKTGQCQALGFSRRLGQQLKAVQRVEEHPGIPVRLQGLGAAEQVLTPGRGGEVHHLAAPGAITYRADRLREGRRVELCLAAVELADRQIGERQAALAAQCLDVGNGQMPRLHDRPVELGQFQERGLVGVPKDHAAGRRQCGGLDGGPCRTHHQGGQQALECRANTNSAKSVFHNSLFQWLNRYRLHTGK
ncbi:hypothetical protein D3C78_1171870 [compost metagenome]